MTATALTAFCIMANFETVLLFLRHCIFSLRFHVSAQSQVMSVDLEAVRIRSSCDGDEDINGSGRDDQESARGTRSSF